jgi:hypothetical protein
MGVATATALVGAGVSIYQASQASKEKSQAENALRNYNRQVLENPYANTQVSTLGSDLQRQEQSRLASSEIEALRGAGTRGIIGGMGRVESGNQRVMASTGADLDAKQKELDILKAQADERNQAIQEGREVADIGALSSQYQAGKQDLNMAIGNGLQSFGSLANIYGNRSNSSNSSGYSTSGYGVNKTNPNYQSSIADQFNENNKYDTNFGNGTGYQTGFNFTDPKYSPSNFVAQPAYGIFNQKYPFGSVYPQNN